MNKEDRGIDFTSIGEPRKITRHRLRFHTRADFEEVLRRGGKDDCISFSSSGGEKKLLGRIVRVADEWLTIEVEAAEDIGEAGFSHQVRWASPPGSEAAAENALFSQLESEHFPEYPPSYSIWDTFGFRRRKIHARGRGAASSILAGEYAEKMQQRLIALLTVLLVIFTLVIVPLANNYCYWHYPFTGSLKCEEEASSSE